MKKLLLIMLMIFEFLLAESISLEECFHGAEQNHPLMRQKSPIEGITRNQLTSLQTGWLPSLDLNLSATYQSDVTKLDIDLPATMGFNLDLPSPDKDNYKSEIEINQMIFDGGLISVQKELARQDNKVSLQKLESDFLKVKTNIVQVFYNLAVLEKQLEILNTWHIDLQESREMLNNMIQNGVLEKSEIYEIDIKINELEQQIAENQIYQKSNRATLSELTGLDIVAEIQLYIPENIEFDSEFSNAQSVLFGYQLDKFNIARKMTFRSRLPKVVSFGKIGYGKPGLNMLSSEFDSYYMIGVGLQWNIWDWNSSKREKEKLNYNQRILELNEEAYNQSTRIKLDQLASNVNNLQEKIIRDKEIYSLHKKLKSVAESKFKNGVINTTDYLKYDNDFVRAEFTKEIHKIQLYREKVNYQILKGDL